MYTIDRNAIGRPYPLGVTIENNRTYFSVAMKSETECGLILYDKNVKEETRIPFDRINKFGSIFCMVIKNLDAKRYEYNFYDGERIVTDPYAKVICGHSKWGTCDEVLRGGFLIDSYDWEEDKPLKIPYSNSILYCLNVRAFTKHRSSGIAHKGTYQGLIEKIPHLKELGITAVELMPAYEFNEVRSKEERVYSSQAATMEEAIQRLALPMEGLKEEGSEKEERYNCWGYIEGYYFAPKAAFSFHKDASIEVKDMVKELHRNGIEVILQFYFPKSVKPGLILDAIKYWVLEYHIDGVHLKGERIPLHVIATDPLLCETKIFYDYFPFDDIYGTQEPAYKNLAIYKDDYMYAARRFLKGDDNALSYFMELQRQNPSRHGIINYVTNYYGFTLTDMVSYDRKHNEDNGEDNEDGNDYNFTWNCGVEGITRKKTVQELRLRQIKNALVMLFSAQGTPLIYSGDELGNTRYGNNNPYCQDNEIGFIKWNMTGMGKKIFSYMKELIALRRQHPVLRNEKEFKILDTMGCGYPDISYHGEEAWRPDFGGHSRYAGVMYCGFYGKTAEKKDDNFFYIAYNMYWLPSTFALPKLPKDMEWCLLTDTSETSNKIEEEMQIQGGARPRIEVPPRTVHIYISRQKKGRHIKKGS